MRSKLFFGVVSTVAIVLAWGALAADAKDPSPKQSQPRLGMNLNGPCDWNKIGKGLLTGAYPS